jgi:Tfp pilus assembly protein PilF
MAKGMNYFAQKDFDKCLDNLKKAVEAAPKTQRAMLIKNMYMNRIEQMKKNAASQPM